MMSDDQRAYDNLKNQVIRPPKVQTPFSDVADARKSVSDLTDRIIMLVAQLIGSEPKPAGASGSGGGESPEQQGAGLVHGIANDAAEIERMTLRAHAEIDRLSKIIG